MLDQQFSQKGLPQMVVSMLDHKQKHIYTPLKVMP